MANVICPRCVKENCIEKVADSPIAGKWEVFRCKECNFVWRSTENLEGISRLTDEKIAQVISYWS